MNKIIDVMSRHKIEVGTVIFLICMIIFLVFAVHSCVENIDKIGGIRSIIVESGKEIKLIANDIDKAVNNHYESERNDLLEEDEETRQKNKNGKSNESNNK